PEDATGDLGRRVRRLWRVPRLPGDGSRDRFVQPDIPGPDHAAHEQDEPVQSDDAPLHARGDRGHRVGPRIRRLVWPPHGQVRRQWVDHCPYWTARGFDARYRALVDEL